ncbi:MAG TPA: PAS domain-containing protein [Halomonas sp.]|jgi:PAS domain-containing protein|uniref:PAS domain-containing protein n=1 Tax=Oceanospirillales TaxID=135619 RepID=UPI0009BC913E|nr:MULTISPECIES: PAS domain-containing protein [Oceanospirillales]MAG53114.1 sensor protein [Halomonas sp.]MCO7243979.1 PAS domain-containing protein [Halomonas sp. Ps84H-12]HAV44183.1 PAS domain-containing protein [Halomonas sp.]HBM42710.1 PAS domain-containing protein [Halomonas sp.]HBP78988.1 PAS domain-containing protein [Halomonas sp.]|tara:strand:+ start:490 stop:1296 length:807 start_codon:yes stop_codon:yes gene_type:complete
MMCLLMPFTFRKRPPNTPPCSSLLDSLNEAVLIVNDNSEILFANRSWQHLIDADSEATPSHLLEYVHPADRDVWQQVCCQVNRQESPAPLWLRVMGAGHELRWCELRAQPLGVGSAWPASLSLCDITPQVQRNQVLSASHRSLSQLVNGLPVMVYRARNNRRWTMEYVSDGCYGLTGYTAETLLNHSLISYGDMIHPQDADQVWEEVQDALREHRSFELDYRIQCADGHLLRVNEKGHGVYSHNAAVLGVEGVIIAFDADPSTSHTDR